MPHSSRALRASSALKSLDVNSLIMQSRSRSSRSCGAASIMPEKLLQMNEREERTRNSGRWPTASRSSPKLFSGMNSSKLQQSGLSICRWQTQTMNGPDQNIVHLLPSANRVSCVTSLNLSSGISGFVCVHPKSLTPAQGLCVRAEAAGLWPSTWLQATGFNAHVAASKKRVIAQLREWIKLVGF